MKSEVPFSDVVANNMQCMYSYIPAEEKTTAASD